MIIRRRQFLAMSTALAGAVAVRGGLPTADAQTLRVRRSINELTPTDPILQTFGEAVRIMHELPDTDERRWMGLARAHLDHCHRQRRHFLTWHRLYLWSFENIVRELTGDADWAVPYWDWTANPQVPSAFFGPDNPLDTQTWKDPDHLTDPDSARVIGPNDTISASTVSLQRVTNQRTYRIFSDQLEGRPHGGVHIAVGGSMGDFLSPLDPLFVVHHCNVDRIWAGWNRQHANPADDLWLDEPFDNMFSDPQGTLITGMTARDLLTTDGLGYAYDDQPPAAELPPAEQDDLTDLFRNTNFKATNLDILSLSNPATLSVKANAAITLAPNFFDREAVLEGLAPKQIVARLSGIEVPADADGYAIRVFLNCPYLTKDTSPEDPHYVTELHLFGLRPIAGMEDMDHDMLVDLTLTLVDLNLRQTPAREELNVQLIAVALPGRKPTGTEFRVSKVEIIQI